SIGLHAHNNLQLATANVLEAVESGCDFVDTTLKGIGRSAGNAQTEIILVLLQRYSRLTGMDLIRTLNVSNKVFQPIVDELAETVPGIRKNEIYRGVNDIELVEGIARAHSGFYKRFRSAADAYEVDVRQLIMTVSDIDCIEPSEDLIDSVTKKMKVHVG
ncbi:hypothetical protein IIA28_20485, partial [candidate division KSB1 bacterium]|nr:hypothetical protein [candidate division KSB1 bacterium]